MHILNHQDFIETRLQSEEWFDGSISFSSAREKTKDKTLSGKKGLLKENFEQFAVEYPDGRTVTLYQDGRITETPKDGKEHAIKLPDKTFIS